MSESVLRDQSACREKARASSCPNGAPFSGQIAQSGRRDTRSTGGTPDQPCGSG